MGKHVAIHTPIAGRNSGRESAKKAGEMDQARKGICRAPARESEGRSASGTDAYNTITTRFAFASNVDALVTQIVAAVEKERCDTIIGRETFTGLDRVFKHHVADDLIRGGQGYTIWVVE